MGAWHFPGTVLTDEDPALGVCGDDKRYMNGVFFLIEVDVQYYISYRCTIQRFTIFKGYIPFIVIIKDWLCSLYCTIYPCSLFYFLFLFLKYIYLFIYFWLRWVFVAARRLSLVAVSGGYSSLQCAGFSLWWLLLLRSTGSRCMAFTSCSMQAQ